MPHARTRPEWLETPGKNAGRYRVGPLLGNGGMGDVFEAWDTVLDRLVALKVLTRVEPAAMVRFMHEAQLQARMEHPNICRIYDIEVYEGVPRIAMQLVRGPTLEDASPDLELAEIVTLVAKVAETLHDAHAQGLIHRDIKPGNVLLEWSGGTWEPILCDFGLALAVNESVLTQPNALTGTPAYMAPEQVRGDRSRVGPHTDVYALGGTLYFLLVGRPPCVSTATQEMLRVKREKRFPLPRTLEPAIPADLEAILLRCLAPDPADRYPAMADLARDLWAFLGKAPAQRPPRVSRRTLWAAGAAAVLLTAAAAGLTLKLGEIRARRAELTSRALQEASNLEEGLRYEREQPIHDTREALKRVREAKDALARQMQGPARDMDAPRNLVLGTADFCLEDYAQARRELQAAWAGGLKAPEAAYRLGVACAQEWMGLAQEASYKGATAPPDLRNQAGDWFKRAKGLSRDREEYAQALQACMAGDLQGAVAHARASQEANPWRREAAALGSLCMTRMAHGFLAKGEEDAAERTFRQALHWAEAGIHQAQSDGLLHHAALAAALGLTDVAMAHHNLDLGSLERVAQRAGQALLVDPDSARAQGDWLSVQCFKALRLEELGQDSGRILDEALAFYWTRTQEPRPPSLQAAHTVLYWLVAKRDKTHGRPPDPAITEALATAGYIEDGPRPDLEDLLRLRTPAMPPRQGDRTAEIRTPRADRAKT